MINCGVCFLTALFAALQAGAGSKERKSADRKCKRITVLVFTVGSPVVLLWSGLCMDRAMKRNFCILLIVSGSLLSLGKGSWTISNNSVSVTVNLSGKSLKWKNRPKGRFFYSTSGSINASTLRSVRHAHWPEWISPREGCPRWCCQSSGSCGRQRSR